MFDQIIILGLLILMVGLFIWGRWRYDAISLGVLSVFVLLGYIQPEEAFKGFSHPAVITVALVLLISKGLERSGFISVIGRKLQDYANTEMDSINASVVVPLNDMNKIFINAGYRDKTDKSFFGANANTASTPDNGDSCLLYTSPSPRDLG